MGGKVRVRLAAKLRVRSRPVQVAIWLQAHAWVLYSVVAEAVEKLVVVWVDVSSQICSLDRWCKEGPVSGGQTSGGWLWLGGSIVFGFQWTIRWCRSPMGAIFGCAWWLKSKDTTALSRSNPVLGRGRRAAGFGQ